MDILGIGQKGSVLLTVQMVSGGTIQLRSFFFSSRPFLSPHTAPSFFPTPFLPTRHGLGLGLGLTIIRGKIPQLVHILESVIQIYKGTRLRVQLLGDMDSKSKGASVADPSL